MPGNQALQVNPNNTSAISIDTHGSDFLWAVFAVMVLADLIVMAWHFTIPRGQRIFHQLAIIILSTAAVAYFSMASNLGYAAITTEFGHNSYPAGVTRSIWYVRYIDWTITTPALLLELVLASGLPLGDIITLMFFDILMIVTGLVGALVASSYKWGFYAFGCAALIYIWFILIGPARSTSRALGPDFGRAYTMSAGILSFLWLLYPIAWGLADGGNVIGSDGEMIFYGVLDILAKPVFCFIHLFALSRVDLTALQLSSGKFSTSAGGPVGVYDRAEKGPRGVATTAAPAVGATGGKKGFFGRRGEYDANSAAAPRTSDATAVPAA